MVYSVSEEGVTALRALSEGVRTAYDEIVGNTAVLLNVVDEHSADLGPHRASIYAVVREILTELKNASEAVGNISGMLNEVADDYEDIIGFDPFRDRNGISTGDNSGAAGAIPGGITGTATGQMAFSGADIGRLLNGAAVVKGENFEQFIEDYYAPEGSVFEPVVGEICVESISPSQIENIHLGDTEADDPSVFWGMHSSSKEFFIETASHIPEVRAALDSGRSLEELKQDPRLGNCASIYFDPENIPRVEKNDGYYTFDGDGRHRILAARELGYNIPVRIVGVRQRCLSKTL